MMADIETKSSTWAFLDVVRHVIIVLATLVVLYSIWKIHWLLAVVAVLPVYTVLLNLVGFLTLPLYYFTPDQKGASELWKRFGKGDTQALQKMTKRVNEMKQTMPFTTLCTRKEHQRMVFFGKPKIEGEELRRCLAYYEAELMVTAFQTREADLFNNTLVKYLNSMTEDPAAAVEVCKAANRLVQGAHEVIMRHERIQPIPDAALAMRCAWSVTFLSLNAWAEATLSAMEALGNGLTPEYAYVQHLLAENQVAQRKAQEEDKKFLRRLKVPPAEINKILSRINDPAATDDWRPKPSRYDFSEGIKTPQKV